MYRLCNLSECIGCPWQAVATQRHAKQANQHNIHLLLYFTHIKRVLRVRMLQVVNCTRAFTVSRWGTSARVAAVQLGRRACSHAGAAMQLPTMRRLKTGPLPPPPPKSQLSMCLCLRCSGNLRHLSYRIASYCTALYIVRTVLYCTIPYRIVPFLLPSLHTIQYCRTVSHRIVPYCIVPHGTVSYRTVPYLTSPHSTSLHVPLLPKSTALQSSAGRVCQR